jgi:hypothetical protein
MQNYGGKHLEKLLLARLRKIWENNIKMDLKERSSDDAK